MKPASVSSFCNVRSPSVTDRLADCRTVKFPLSPGTKAAPPVVVKPPSVIPEPDCNREMLEPVAVIAPDRLFWATLRSPEPALKLSAPAPDRLPEPLTVKPLPLDIASTLLRLLI